MSNIKKKRIYSKDREFLKRVQEEYTLLGFDTGLDNECLTVFTTRNLDREEKRRAKRRRREEQERS